MALRRRTFLTLLWAVAVLVKLFKRHYTSDLLARTLADPDLVRRSTRSGHSRLVSRWFPELLGGKHIVAVVMTDATSGRLWLVTAYISGKLVPGVTEWQKS
jgi:hypothetical protein